MLEIGVVAAVTMTQQVKDENPVRAGKMAYETYPVVLVGGETVKENDRLPATVSFQVGNRVVINFDRDLFYPGETPLQRQANFVQRVFAVMQPLGQTRPRSSAGQRGPMVIVYPPQRQLVEKNLCRVESAQ